MAGCAQWPSSAITNGYRVIVKQPFGIGKIDNSKIKDEVDANSNEAIIEILLDIDLDQKDPHGSTPLLLATNKNGQASIVRQLLQTEKADFNLQDWLGQTPLLLLASTYGRGSVVEQLLGTGKVDINLRGQFGRTPLLLVASKYGYGSIVRPKVDDPEPQSPDS
jgi:ankyrin repeat protein